MKKSRNVSIFFVPDDGAPPTLWRVRRLSLRLLKTGAVLLGIVVVLGAISYWKVADLAFRARAFEERNARLELQVRKMASLERVLAEIRGTDEQLRMMLGLGVGDSTAFTMSRDRLLVGGSRPLEWGKQSESPVGLISGFIPSGWPVEGWITAEFEGKSTPAKRRHEGIDIAAQHGSVVKATAAGAVIFAGWDDDLGNLVVIDHGGHFATRYGHNSSVLVRPGDTVWKGQAIALVGTTGHSTAPHLHYEVLEKGRPKDPQKFLLLK